MPKKITIIGYTINELEPKVKDKVIENYSEINTEHDWYESNYEEFYEKLAEYGLGCKDFTWDLYRGEFEFNHIYIENQELLLKKLELSKYLIPLEMATKGDYIIDIKMNPIEVCVDFDYEKQDDIMKNSPLSDDELRDFDCAILDKLTDLIDGLKSDMLKTLKDDYEYLTSREAIVDTLDANEYLFTKEGKHI